jgi:hypothetical protein
MNTMRKQEAVAQARALITKTRASSWLLILLAGLFAISLFQNASLNHIQVLATLEVDSVQPTRSIIEPNRGSLLKLRNQLAPDQEANFDRSQKIYVDFGLSDAKDTELHLSKGYSVASVDAFLPWITKAKEKFSKEIAQNRLMLFNVGLATEEAEAMPLYFKNEGSVIASFVQIKGCQGLPSNSPKCLHADVEVVRCEAILQLINAQVETMKVDIEMLHHSCLRGLHRLETSILPKYVCWEEHDKPFGSARTRRPITDTKLILGLYELGYDGVKVVMQGHPAPSYYGIDKSVAGFGQGSGSLSPEEMMHYRSHEQHADGKFDTDWRQVHEILQEGVFSQTLNKSAHFLQRCYFDICMKLSPDAESKRAKRQEPGSFPLASYAKQ